MSEVQQADSGGGKKGGKPKAKKMSTHMDMTPMVDLAFLLLTFFMLTTTFSKPKTMQITMPAKNPKDQPKPKDPITARHVFNLLLGTDNKLYAYVGKPETLNKDEFEELNYSEASLRKRLFERFKEDTQTMVLIKPVPNARYENMVTVFDEMLITKQKIYAMVKPVAKELEWLEKKGANSKVPNTTTK